MSAFANLFPSKYLKKEDVLNPVTTTIQALTQEDIKTAGGNESKPILYMVGLKPMVLNKSNATVLYEVYGEPVGWPGRAVEVYCDPSVMFGGKRVGGVKLRIPAHQPVQGQPGFQPVTYGAPQQFQQPQQPVDPSNRPWELAEAYSQASLAGITKQEVNAAFKAAGLPNYLGARDTHIVRDLIAKKRAANLQPQNFDADPPENFGGNQVGEQIIPF